MGKEYRKNRKKPVIEPETEDIVDEPEAIIDYQSELLDILKRLPPNGFERICQRLLHEQNTVHGYIKQFEKAGIIKIWDFNPEGKKQGQTVFILGTWTKVNGIVVESYFRDTKLITPKTGKK